MDVNEIVNLGVSICLNIFFIKYFFSEHKKMTENISKLVIELIDMNKCIERNTKELEKLDDNISNLKKVG